MTDTDTIRIARNADEVLQNEAYTGAMASLKAQIVAQWKDCPVRDQEGQRLLLQLAKLADKFDGILRGYVEAGRLAQHKIDVSNERNESVAHRIVRRAFTG